MKLRLMFCLLLLSGVAQAQTVYQTLFLGNSYTGVNDLPSIVYNLTIAGGDSLIRDSNTPGGYTFQGHSTNSTSLAMIRSRPWDFVVLQEQSQRPSFPQSQVQTEVYPYASQLNDSIKANDSCTVTVFYMTWGRKHGDASNCGFWPPVCTYAGMQNELRTSYLNMANQNQALVAPCGVAWWESILRDSTLELYSPDESHPSYAGSYLTGCVMYATMYRRSPVGLGFHGILDTLTAQFLQQVAHDVVFDSLTQWRIGLDDVSAGFGFVTDLSGETNFSNASVNATSYQWTFGDGGTSTDAQPVHTYSTAGFYPVTLIATNGCTSDTLTDTVEVILVGLAAEFSSLLQVSPNPTRGHLRVEMRAAGTDGFEVSVMDIGGKVLVQKPMEALGGQWSAALDLSAFPQGMYLIGVTGDQGLVASQRVVLE